MLKDVKKRLKEILIELCEWLDIKIIEGAICSDHVHMYVSMPPKYSPSYVMKVLKGKSAEQLRKKFPELRKKYWGMHIWARGYFVSTVGVDSAIIKKYVHLQQETEIRDDQLRLWKDNDE